jgi:UDP-3-O-[3-hydroxymyristoyl] glucosamine N-acyltransferase
MRYTQDIKDLNTLFPGIERQPNPWNATGHADEIIGRMITRRFVDSPSEYLYSTDGKQAIHVSARVDPSARLQDSVVVGPGAMVGPNAFLRGGVYVASKAVVGFATEVKSTFIGRNSMLSHLNFVGDSIIGSDVVIEAGAVVANTGPESETVKLVLDDQVIDTAVPKFGAIIGDGAHIGANAVLREGTLLAIGFVVPRMAYIDQMGQLSQ